MKEEYNRKNIDTTEVVRYKKKSQKKTPAKTNHKHEFHDCIFEWDNPHGKLDKIQGFTTKHEIHGGSYCSICGKISYDMSFEWSELVSFGKWLQLKLSGKAEQEINPETRTLPTFVLDDWYKQKFINLDKEQNE